VIHPRSSGGNADKERASVASLVPSSARPGPRHALNALYEADRVAGLVGIRRDIRSLDYRDRPEVMAAEAPDLQSFK
jgi:hypothetical protein